MIKKTKELKVELEGQGKRYRDGKPRYKVIGASKEVLEREAEMVELEDVQCSGSSEMFELRSADHSLLEHSSPPQEWQGFE